MLKGIGHWPVDGESVRKTGEFVKVNDDNKLRTIFGKKYPVPVNFFYSTDLGHMGEIIIPFGGCGVRAMEEMSIKGDATFFVEDGPITFFFPDTQDTFTVEENEVMFIPANTTFQCINYNAKIVKTIFSVGGKDF
jgi:hypothetical protein